MIILRLSTNQANAAAQAIRLYASIRRHDYEAIAEYACIGPSIPRQTHAYEISARLKHLRKRLIEISNTKDDGAIRPKRLTSEETQTLHLVEAFHEEARRTRTKCVEFEISIDQARILNDALDFFTRIGLGQFTAIAEIASLTSENNPHEAIDEKLKRHFAFVEQLEELRAGMGYARGQSWGLGARQTHHDCLSAYEIHKVLAQQIELHRDPLTHRQNVDSDGLIVRYTNGPAPEARLII